VGGGGPLSHQGVTGDRDGSISDRDKEKMAHLNAERILRL
jgi:hypothetical protein